MAKLAPALQSPVGGEERVGIVEKAKESIDKTGQFNFALSGGSSPKKLYELLASSNYGNKIDWKSVFFPETKLCRVDMEFSYRPEIGPEVEFEETHWQRAYSLDELKEMLTNSGFEDITLFDAYSFNKPGKRAERVFFVARKTND